MGKYIDAEKLTELISQTEKEFTEKSETKGYTTLEYQHKAEGLQLALQYITYLHQEQQPEYVRKDMVVDAIKLAYGKVSMNPFDCSDAFEELLKKIGYEMH